MKSVLIDIRGRHLIQSVRMMHAISEAGYAIQVMKGEERIWAHLKKHFDINTTQEAGVKIDAEVCHKTPFCRIGDETKRLVFPHAVAGRMREMWSDKREGIYFRGLLAAESRVKWMRRWSGRATIEETNSGRVGPQRFWDEEYMKRMGKAEFALCPFGGYRWTYRVIEACLLGATPILQGSVAWYEGMYYCTVGGKLERRNVEDNREWATRLVTMSLEKIREQIEK